MAAAEKLGGLGGKAASAVKSLAKAVADEHHGVREAAVWALGEIGVASKPVVAALASACKDRFWLVREGAVTALGKLGKGALAAIPDLEKAMLDQRDECRRLAAEALARMGPKGAKALGGNIYLEEARAALGTMGKDGLPVLLEKIKGKDAKDRVRALEALGSMGTDAKRASGRLKGLLRDRDGGVRIQAVLTLYRITGTKKYLTLAVKSLRDKNLGMRRHCANLLGELGPLGKDAVPDLLGALKTTDAGLFRCAGNALVRIGPDEKVVNAILDGLESPNREIREGAVWLLGPCGAKAGPGVPILVQIMRVLKTEDRSFVLGAVKALQQIGPAAREAVPILIDVWTGESVSHLRDESGKALVRIGGPAAAPLTELLKSGKHGEERLMEMLLEIGPDAECALPVLKEKMGDAMNCQNTSLVAFAVCKISPGDEAAFTALLKHLKDFRYRHSLARLIYRYGLPEERAGEVLPLLVGNLADKKHGNAGYSLAAIGSFGPRAKTAVPVLMLALQDHGTRFTAVEALGRIGPDAKAAVPAILDAAAARNIPDVHKLYREALRSIRGR